MTPSRNFLLVTLMVCSLMTLPQWRMIPHSIFPNANIKNLEVPLKVAEPVKTIIAPTATPVTLHTKDMPTTDMQPTKAPTKPTNSPKPNKMKENKKKKGKNNGKAAVLAREKARISRLAEVFPKPEPQISVSEAGSDCQPFERQIDGIQVHVIGWRRKEGMQRLLNQLETANYTGWETELPLHVHLDGGASPEVAQIVQEFSWNYGPKIQDFRTQNVGLREMWISSIGKAAQEAGPNTLLIIFEDDIDVAPAYFQWLLAMIDQYARHPGCRDASLAGFSLSPLVYQNMYTPFHPWDADVAVQARYTNNTRVPAYLSAIPSSWGVAYWSDRWMDFDRFVGPRMQPPFYNREAGGLKGGLMTPKFFEVPGAFFNQWTKSWKRFMIDIMHVRGWVMLYPNLKGHKGLSSASQGDGVHGGATMKNRYAVDLLERWEIDSEGILPSYDRLAIFGLDYVPRSRELLLAIGHGFFDHVARECQDPACPELLHVWDGNAGTERPPRLVDNDVPLTCIADVHTPVAASQNKSTASMERFLVWDTNGNRLKEALSWAHVLRRTLILPPNTEQMETKDANMTKQVSLDSLVSPPQPWRTIVIGNETNSSWFEGSKYSLEMSHLFRGALPLSTIQHYFGACNDTVLSFRG